MKKYFLLLIISLFLFIPTVYAEVNTSTGFLSNQIWYSQNSFEEGNTVKVYTAIWNGYSSPLTAEVDFYDKNVILGTRNITIPSQQLQDVSIPWKITSGNHIILAKITSSVLDINGDKKEIIIISKNTTNSDSKFIPVTVKTQNGQTVTNNQMLSDEVTKLGNKINEVLPTFVSTQISNGITKVDLFRNKTLTKITDSEDKVQNQLLSLEDSIQNEDKMAESKIEGKSPIVAKTKSLMDSTEKPIAQVKLFFLKILDFIFNTKIVFYSLIVIITLYILRFVYHKFTN